MRTCIKCNKEKTDSDFKEKSQKCLDISGVEPFITNKGQEPGVPHFIMWAAGAVLGIYKTYKKNIKI